jgi:hypothetical protein
MTSIPAFAHSKPGNVSGSVGLKVQLASDASGDYVPVVALDTEAAITIGAVTANAGTNLNTSALALESGGNLAALAGAVSAGKVQTTVATALPTGSNTVGKVGIDQTTPGTTNKVSIGTDGLVGPSGSNGVDYSANAPSLSGLSLLATMPASATRLGYFIQSQSTAGLTVVMDDQAGSLTATIIVLAGAAANGGQGGALSMDGIPHTGRIRIYSSSSGVQMAARAW